MAINFPNSPSPNDTYTVDQKTWLYNGTAWQLVNNASGYTGSQGAGYTGSQGDLGYTGSIGYTGSKGSDGTIGIDGYTGSVGYTGSQGPSNLLNASAVTTDSAFYPVFVAGTGNQTPSIRTAVTAFSFNASTSLLTIGGNVSASSFTSTVTTGTVPFVVNSTTQVANLNVATAGTAGTVTTAAQPNITSLGNLTIANIDNIQINDNTISSTNTNGNILLTPNGTGIVISNSAFRSSGLQDSSARTLLIKNSAGTVVWGN